MTATALLINPPSPRGMTANREGFGGLGVTNPGRKGFCYPAQRLAEVAGGLTAAGWSVTGADGVMAPWRARRCRAIARRRPPTWVVLQVSRWTLRFDLEWWSAQRVGCERLLITGVGIEPPSDVPAPVAGATWDSAPSGFETATRILGVFGSAGSEKTPFACWDTLPLGRTRRLPIYHGRGCTFGCGYCPYVVGPGRKLRVRAPEETLAEFAYQVGRHQPRRVVFRDPAFALDEGSTLRVLEGIRALDPRFLVPFEVETRPELLTDAILDALAAAGCVEVKIGVETLEPEALRASVRLGPGQSEEDYAVAARRAVLGIRSRGMMARAYLMRGLPGSTPEGQQQTQQRLADLGTFETKELRWPEAEPDFQGAAKGPGRQGP